VNRAASGHLLNSRLRRASFGQTGEVNESEAGSQSEARSNGRS
jgi:hypothetical protein